MKLQLRPSLFWDVDVKSIDLQKNRAFVIERITSRGRFEEFKAMVKYYGKLAVKDVLLQTRYINKETLSFCTTVFEVPITEFRCYKLAQSNPGHWNY
jgi:hypothetical protein